MKLITVLLLCTAAFAQSTLNSDRTFKGKVDAHNAVSTLPNRSGAGSPVGRDACLTLSESYFQTDASAGSNTFGCTTTGSAGVAVWSLQGGGGGGGGGTTTLTAGLGMLVTGTGSPYNVAINPAVTATREQVIIRVDSYVSSASNSNTTYTGCPNTNSPAGISINSGDLVAPLTIDWKPDVNGAGGATTLNVCATGAVPVKENDGSTNPTSSDIVAGRIYTLKHDGTSFRLPAVTAGGGGTTRTWSYVFQGSVQAAATGFSLNLPASSAPTLTNSGGTVPIAVLEWPSGGSTGQTAWATFILPTGYVTNAALSFSVEYRSADSTHATILTPSLACQGTSSTLDNPTFGAAPTVNLTAGASSHQTITTGTWTPNSGSIPACSAGQRIWIKLSMDTNTNILTSPFDLVSLTVTLTAGI